MNHPTVEPTSDGGTAAQPAEDAPPRAKPAGSVAKRGTARMSRREPTWTGGQSGGRWLWILLAAALVVRALLLSRLPLLYTLDSPAYLKIARDIAVSGSFEDFRLGVLRLPAYPTFLAAIRWIAGEGPIWIRVAQILLGTVTAYAIYSVAARFVRSRGLRALIAALPALAPPYLLYEQAVMSECLAVALTALTVLALITWSEYPISPRAAAVAGFLTSALFLTRLNALALVAVLALLPLWRLAESWSIPSRRAPALRTLASFGLAGAVLAAPWIARNERVLGRPALLTSSHRIALVYAMQAGLVDAVQVGRELHLSKIDTDRDPVFAVFWSLASRGVEGERQAGRILERTVASNSSRAWRLRLDAAVSFLGLARGSGPSEGERLVLDLRSEEPRLLRIPQRMSRFLEIGRSVTGDLDFRAASSSARAYAAWFRPALSCVWLISFGFLWRIRRWDPSTARLLLALFFAHLATVLLHGWSLASSDRFAYGFDWIPWLCIVALLANDPMEPEAE